MTSTFFTAETKPTVPHIMAFQGGFSEVLCLQPAQLQGCCTSIPILRVSPTHVSVSHLHLRIGATPQISRVLSFCFCLSLRPSALPPLLSSPLYLGIHSFNSISSTYCVRCFLPSLSPWNVSKQTHADEITGLLVCVSCLQRPLLS